jgi:hypothetical protein
MDTAIGISRAAEPRTLGLSWPLLVAMLTVAGVLWLMPTGRALSDPDTYWHLASGRWIIENGRVPAVDIFSFTMAGSPWTAHEWLSQLLMLSVHEMFGWAGLVAMATASLAFVLALMTRFLLARMEPVHALLFTGFAAGMLLSHTLARPHVLAWSLLAVWLATLVEAAESGRRPPWWLAGVMVLWANMHGSFTMGLVLCVGIAVDAVLRHAPEGRRAASRSWAGFCALAILAAMVTPHGWGGYIYTVQVMYQPVALSSIGEWLSPNFQKLQPLEVWLLLVLAIGLTGRVRVPIVRLALLLFLVHIALKHQRYTAVLGLVSPFLLALPLARSWYSAPPVGRDAESLDRWFKSLANTAKAKTTAVCVALVGLLMFGTLQLRPPLPSEAITPQAAVDAALAAGAQGQVLNDYGFGGYLIHRKIPVFIDGRSDMYGDAYLEAMLRAFNLRDRKDLIQLIDKHRFGWSVLANGTPAVAVLDELPGWRRVYTDAHAVAHIRIDSGPQARP